MLSDERIQEILAEKAGCWVAPHLLAGVKAVAEAAVKDERENRNRPMALREFAELVQKLVIIGPLTSEQGRQLMMLQEMASTTLEAAVKDAVGGEVVAWFKLFKGEPQLVPYKTFIHEDAVSTGWQPLYTRPQASAAVPEYLYSIAEGQWWIKELEGIFAGPFTHDQKRAANIALLVARHVISMLAASQPEVKS